MLDDTGMFDDSDDALEFNQEESDDVITVDYKLAQMIQIKVSIFSVKKTREQLEKLKQIQHIR